MNIKIYNAKKIEKNAKNLIQDIMQELSYGGIGSDVLQANVDEAVQKYNELVIGKMDLLMDLNQLVYHIRKEVASENMTNGISAILTQINALRQEMDFVKMVEELPKARTTIRTDRVNDTQIEVKLVGLSEYCSELLEVKMSTVPKIKKIISNLEDECYSLNRTKSIEVPELYAPMIEKYSL